MLSFEEFVSIYDKNGRCINQISTPKKGLTENQLKQQYNKYLKQEEKRAIKKLEQISKPREIKIDEKWIEVTSFVKERDKNECQLLRNIDYLLGKGSRDTIEKLSNGLYKIVDPAHIFPRSSYPHLKYDPDNVVCLNRFSHSHIDLYRDPLEGRYSINFSERLEYFSWMVGEEKIKRLKIKAGKL